MDIDNIEKDDKNAMIQCCDIVKIRVFKRSKMMM